MTMIARLFLLGCWIGLICSCTKPVTLGSDFLEEEKSALAFKDDFDLTFHTQKTDSIIVHSGNNVTRQLVTYSLGRIQDPVFGRYSSEIYAQPILSAVAWALLNSTLDSVVLSLRYDTLGTYGDISQPVTLEVFRMSENPDFKQDYYSNERFMTFPDMLGSKTFIPAPKDSVELITPSDTLLRAPHIRIALDVSKFADFINPDSSVYENVDTFVQFFNGLHIRMTGAENTMLGINLLNAVSGLTFYFDKDSTENQQFTFIFTAGSVKTVYMEQDYSGTPVEVSFGPDPESDFWYIQGLSGPFTTMSIGGLESLGNVVINLAELEVYATHPAGDNPAWYPPVDNIITQYDADTSLVISTDVLEALSAAQGSHLSSTYETLFGGHRVDTIAGPPAIYRYNMKVTNQVSEIYKGIRQNVVYFNPFSKGDFPNRAILFGPNHPIYAPRLRIYYTAL